MYNLQSYFPWHKLTNLLQPLLKFYKLIESLNASAINNFCQLVCNKNVQKENLHKMNFNYSWITSNIYCATFYTHLSFSEQYEKPCNELLKGTRKCYETLNLNLDNRYDMLWTNFHYKLNLKTFATNSCFNPMHVDSQLYLPFNVC